MSDGKNSTRKSYACTCVVRNNEPQQASKDGVDLCYNDHFNNPLEDNIPPHAPPPKRRRTDDSNDNSQNNQFPILSSQKDSSELENPLDPLNRNQEGFLEKQFKYPEDPLSETSNTSSVSHTEVPRQFHEDDQELDVPSALTFMDNVSNMSISQENLSINTLHQMNGASPIFHGETSVEALNNQRDLPSLSHTAYYPNMVADGSTDVSSPNAPSDGSTILKSAIQNSESLLHGQSHPHSIISTKQNQNVNAEDYTADTYSQTSFFQLLPPNFSQTSFADSQIMQEKTLPEFGKGLELPYEQSHLKEPFTETLFDHSKASLRKQYDDKDEDEQSAISSALSPRSKSNQPLEIQDNREPILEATEHSRLNPRENLESAFANPNLNSDAVPQRDLQPFMSKSNVLNTGVISSPSQENPSPPVLHETNRIYPRLKGDVHPQKLDAEVKIEFKPKKTISTLKPPHDLWWWRPLPVEVVEEIPGSVSVSIPAIRPSPTQIPERNFEQPFMDTVFNLSKASLLKQYDARDEDEQPAITSALSPRSKSNQTLEIQGNREPILEGTKNSKLSSRENLDSTFSKPNLKGDAIIRRDLQPVMSNESVQRVRSRGDDTESPLFRETDSDSLLNGQKHPLSIRSTYHNQNVSTEPYTADNSSQTSIGDRWDTQEKPFPNVGPPYAQGQGRNIQEPFTETLFDHSKASLHQQYDEDEQPAITSALSPRSKSNQPLEIQDNREPILEATEISRLNSRENLEPAFSNLHYKVDTSSQTSIGDRWDIQENTFPESGKGIGPQYAQSQGMAEDISAHLGKSTPSDRSYLSPTNGEQDLIHDEDKHPTLLPTDTVKAYMSNTGIQTKESQSLPALLYQMNQISLSPGVATLNSDQSDPGSIPYYPNLVDEDSTDDTSPTLLSEGQDTRVGTFPDAVRGHEPHYSGTHHGVSDDISTHLEKSVPLSNSYSSPIAEGNDVIQEKTFPEFGRAPPDFYHADELGLPSATVIKNKVTNTDISPENPSINALRQMNGETNVEASNNQRDLPSIITSHSAYYPNTVAESSTDASSPNVFSGRSTIQNSDSLPDGNNHRFSIGSTEHNQNVGTDHYTAEYSSQTTFAESQNAQEKTFPEFGKGLGPPYAQNQGVAEDLYAPSDIPYLSPANAEQDLIHERSFPEFGRSPSQFHHDEDKHHQATPTTDTVKGDVSNTGVITKGSQSLPPLHQMNQISPLPSAATLNNDKSHPDSIPYYPNVVDKGSTDDRSPTLLSEGTHAVSHDDISSPVDKPVSAKKSYSSPITEENDRIREKIFPEFGRAPHELYHEDELKVPSDTVTKDNASNMDISPENHSINAMRQTNGASPIFHGETNVEALNNHRDHPSLIKSHTANTVSAGPTDVSLPNASSDGSTIPKSVIQTSDSLLHSQSRPLPIRPTPHNQNASAEDYTADNPSQTSFIQLLTPKFSQTSLGDSQNAQDRTFPEVGKGLGPPYSQNQGIAEDLYASSDIPYLPPANEEQDLIHERSFPEFGRSPSQFHHDEDKHGQTSPSANTVKGNVSNTGVNTKESQPLPPLHQMNQISPLPSAATLNNDQSHPGSVPFPTSYYPKNIAGGSMDASSPNVSSDGGTIQKSASSNKSSPSPVNEGEASIHEKIFPEFGKAPPQSHHQDFDEQKVPPVTTIKSNVSNTGVVSSSSLENASPPALNQTKEIHPSRLQEDTHTQELDAEVKIELTPRKTISTLKDPHELWWWHPIPIEIEEEVIPGSASVSIPAIRSFPSTHIQGRNLQGPYMESLQRLGSREDETESPLFRGTKSDSLFDGQNHPVSIRSTKHNQNVGTERYTTDYSSQTSFGDNRSTQEKTFPEIGKGLGPPYTQNQGTAEDIPSSLGKSASYDRSYLSPNNSDLIRERSFPEFGRSPSQFHHDEHKHQTSPSADTVRGNMSNTGVLTKGSQSLPALHQMTQIYPRSDVATLNNDQSHSGSIPPPTSSYPNLIDEDSTDDTSPILLSEGKGTRAGTFPESVRGREPQYSDSHGISDDISTSTPLHKSIPVSNSYSTPITEGNDVMREKIFPEFGRAPSEFYLHEDELGLPSATVIKNNASNTGISQENQLLPLPPLTTKSSTTFQGDTEANAVESHTKVGNNDYENPLEPMGELGIESSSISMRQDKMQEKTLPEEVRAPSKLPGERIETRPTVYEDAPFFPPNAITLSDMKYQAKERQMNFIAEHNPENMILQMDDSDSQANLNNPILQLTPQTGEIQANQFPEVGRTMTHVRAENQGMHGREPPFSDISTLPNASRHENLQFETRAKQIRTAHTQAPEDFYDPPIIVPPPQEAGNRNHYATQTTTIFNPSVMPPWAEEFLSTRCGKGTDGDLFLNSPTSPMFSSYRSYICGSLHGNSRFQSEQMYYARCCGGGSNYRNGGMLGKSYCEELLSKYRNAPLKPQESLEVKDANNNANNKNGVPPTPDPSNTAKPPIAPKVKKPKSEEDDCCCAYYSWMIWLILLIAIFMLLYLIWWRECGVKVTRLAAITDWSNFPIDLFSDLGKVTHQMELLLSTLGYFAYFILTCLFYIWCKICTMPKDPRNICSCKEIKLIIHFVYGILLLVFLYLKVWPYKTNKGRYASSPRAVHHKFECLEVCFWCTLVLLILGVLVFTIFSIERRMIRRRIAPAPVSAENPRDQPGSNKGKPMDEQRSTKPVENMKSLNFNNAPTSVLLHSICAERIRPAFQPSRQMPISQYGCCQLSRPIDCPSNNTWRTRPNNFTNSC